jgi:hypothetical protein
VSNDVIYSISVNHGSEICRTVDDYINRCR